MHIFVVLYLRLMHNVVILFLTMQMSPLQRVRLKKKLTLQQVADEVGIHQTTLMRIENGEVWPSKKTVNSLVSFFGKKVKEIEILWPERFN